MDTNAAHYDVSSDPEDSFERIDHLSDEEGVRSSVEGAASGIAAAVATQVEKEKSATKSFYCYVCDCTLKDSIAYRDHVNSLVHLERLNTSLALQRAALSEVKARLLVNELKREKDKQLFDTAYAEVMKVRRTVERVKEGVKEDSSDEEQASVEAEVKKDELSHELQDASSNHLTREEPVPDISSDEEDIGQNEDAIEESSSDDDTGKNDELLAEQPEPISTLESDIKTVSRAIKVIGWTLFIAFHIFMGMHTIQFVLKMVTGFDLNDLPMAVKVISSFFFAISCIRFWWSYWVPLPLNNSAGTCACCASKSPEKQCKMNNMPIRRVILNTDNGKYGFVVRNNFVKEFIAGGVAQMHGGLLPGDEIVAVNGTNTKTAAHDHDSDYHAHDQIISLIRKRSNTVELLVRYNPFKAKLLQELP